MNANRLMIVLGAVGFVAACGSSEAGNMDGGGDAQQMSDTMGTGDAPQNPDAASDASGDSSSDATSDAKTDGPTLDGGDAGACASDWSACLMCLTSQCNMEIIACNASMACKNAFVTLATCESTCGNNCDNNFQNVNNQANDLIDCGANNCSACSNGLGW